MAPREEETRGTGSGPGSGPANGPGSGPGKAGTGNILRKAGTGRVAGEWAARLLAPLATELLLLGGGLLLLVPLLLRVLAGNPLIPGAESYAHLHGLSQHAGAYDLFLTALSPLGDARILASVLLGLAAAYLFARLAKGLLRHEHERTIALLLFLVNPLFLSVFTAMTPMTLVVPLGLLAAVAAKEGRDRLLAVALPLTALLSPTAAAALAAALLLLTKRRRPTAVASLVALPAAAASMLFLSPVTFIPSVQVAEFGAVNGLSLVLAGLAVMEGVAAWDEREGRAAFLLFLAALAVSPLEQGFRVVAGFASSVLAAGLVARLARRKWSLRDAQPLVLLLVACLLLFLLLTHIGAITREPPTDKLVRTLAALPPDGGVVLSPPALSPFVEALAGHPALPREHECDSPSERCNDVERLYYTWRMDDAEPILAEYNITYLLITQEMRDGAVWNRDDEGLLFLLDHSERFKRVAADPQEELWKYTPPAGTGAAPAGTATGTTGPTADATGSGAAQ